MKFVISRADLSNLIRKIQNVVPQSAPLPILSHFLVEAKNGMLIFTATDLTVSARCQAKAHVIEEGAIALPSRRFFQLVRELVDTDIEVTSDSKEIAEIKAGSSRFRLHGMDKNEYPELPDLSKATSFNIDSSKLKEMLYKTAFAVAKEDNRYVLTGVLMRIENAQALFVGTDGKRLARTIREIPVGADHSSEHILPLKAVDEMMKILSESQSSTVFLGDDKMAVDNGETLLITRVLSGDYPDFEQILSHKGNTVCSLHREELTTLLRQISLFTTDSATSVRFSFTNGELVITANSAEIGDAKVKMVVNYEGPKLEIAFNPHYFLDVLRHTEDETIDLALSDPFNPGIITDSTQTLFIIMPMRLSKVADEASLATSS